jgi:hypothetical protein
VNTGGPAFPCQPCDRQGQPVAEMSPGMTLLDWFAGQALAGMCANPHRDLGWSGGAQDAYKHAVAMLAEKQRREGGAQC